MLCNGTELLFCLWSWDDVQPKSLLVVCRKRDRGDKEFLPYHVTIVTPPPRHLGVHSLPPVRPFQLCLYSHVGLSNYREHIGKTKETKGKTMMQNIQQIKMKRQLAKRGCDAVFAVVINARALLFGLISLCLFALMISCGMLWIFPRLRFH